MNPSLIWRYFKTKSNESFWRTNKFESEYFGTRGWEKANKGDFWTAENFLSRGWYETDEHGNPLMNGNKNIQPSRERDDLLNELQVRMDLFKQITQSMAHDAMRYGEWQRNYSSEACDTLMAINRVRSELGWERIEL